MQKKTYRTVLGSVVASLAIYFAIGFWGVPKGINWALEKYASPLLLRSVTTEEISFNPFTLRLQIKGLNIQKEQETEPLIHLKELDTQVSWFSLFKLAPIISHLKLDGLHANIERTGLTTFSFSDIIDHIQQEFTPDPLKEEVKETDSEPFYFAISESSILNSSLTLKDHFRNRIDRIDNLNFQMPLVSNFESDIKNQITPRLTLTFNGKPLSVDVQSIPFTLSKRTGVDFSLRGLSVENLASFNPVPLNVKVREGTIDAKLNLAFAENTGSRNAFPHLRLAGVIALNDVLVDDVQGKPYSVTQFKKLTIDLESFAFFAKVLKIRELRLIQPNITVIRNNDAVNLATLSSRIVREDTTQKIENKKETPNVASTVPKEKDWFWELNQAVIENGTVHFEDRPVHFAQNLSNFNATLKGLSSRNSVADLDLSFNLLDGVVKTQGTLTAIPFKTDLMIESTNLSVPLLSPYFSYYTNTQVAQGRLNHKGHLKVQSSTKSPSIQYNADIRADQFKIVDPFKNTFVSWKQISAQNLKIDVTQQTSVRLNRLTVDTPRIRITQNENKETNLSKLGPQALETSNQEIQPNTKVSANLATNNSSTMPIQVDKIQVKNGAIIYNNDAVKPPFTTRLTELNATVNQLSSTSSRSANLDVEGLLDGTRLEVKGTLNPFNAPTLNLEGSLASLSLHNFSPFSAEFTGYPIKQGHLNFNGAYSLKDDLLKGNNAIQIHKLEFGALDPNAKSPVPVGLAVSLLQNRDGRIDLNIPISGSINDPEFSVSGVILKVIVNLFSKAITSPFALIGSVFGGSPDMDLSHIEFASGSSDLSPENTKALEIIAKAMQDRPALKVKIMGVANLEMDEAGLKEIMLQRMIATEVYHRTQSRKSLSADQINKGINQLYRLADDTGKPNKADTATKKAFLLGQIKVTEKEIQKLATSRATRVRDFLVKEQKVEENRLFITNLTDSEMQKSKPGIKFDVEP